jgi:HEAT repeat protein
MGSPLTDMRLEAARAAGSIGSSDLVPGLEELTEDEELEVRLAAVHALGQIGGDSAFRILERLAEDPDQEELHAAVDEALEEMEWLGGEIGLTLFDVGEEDDEDEPYDRDEADDD